MVEQKTYPLKSSHEQCVNEIVRRIERSEHTVACIPFRSTLNSVVNSIIGEYKIKHKGSKIAIIADSHETMLNNSMGNHHLHGTKYILDVCEHEISDYIALSDFEELNEFEKYSLVILYDTFNMHELKKINQFNINSVKTLRIHVADDFCDVLSFGVDLSLIDPVYRSYTLYNEFGYKECGLYWITSTDTFLTPWEENYLIQEKKSELIDLQYRPENIFTNPNHAKNVVAPEKSYLFFCEFLLRQIGYDKSQLEENYKKIESARKNVEKEKINDENIKKLYDETTSVFSNLLSKVLRNKRNYEYYEKYLINKIGEENYKKMGGDACTFLITGKAIFDNLSEESNQTDLDYSSVCLEITKAIELEVCMRFCYKYADYLEKHSPDVKKWPRSLLIKKGDGTMVADINDRKPLEKLMLGDVSYTMSVIVDKNTGVTSVKNEHFFKKYLEFVKNELYLPMSEDEMRKNLLTACEFIEKIRRDYRNPSAHKEFISKISAEECIDYVIGAHKMLKTILDPMRSSV